MAASEQAVNGAKKALPPYVAHRTYTNFINGLAQGIPLRIDKSIMRTLAGSTQGQLMATLRYFELIEADGKPTELLPRLVNSEGPERQKITKEIVNRAYAFVFGSDLDLQKATTEQVEELFSAEGLSGETRRKSFGFFLALCKDAGIQLSPHIKAPKSAPSSRRRTSRSNAGSEENGGAATTQTEQTLGWSQLLLSKFPSFDPNWPEETQKRWFDSFEKLMKHTEESE
jgi:hypothetical protein